MNTEPPTQFGKTGISDEVAFVSFAGKVLLIASIFALVAQRLTGILLVNPWLGITGVFLAAAMISMASIRRRELGKSKPSGWKS